jgi:hypothetical protein
MPYKINEKHIESVSRLSGPERYAYALPRMADWEEVWSLKSKDGWVRMGDKQGRQFVPIWPHPRLAEVFADGEWKDHEARSIPLDEWMEKWIPGMERDGTLIAVFPVPKSSEDKSDAVVVSPARLKTDLEEELSKFE